MLPASADDKLMRKLTQYVQNLHFECSFCNESGSLSYWDFIHHKLKCENSYALTQFKCPFTCAEPKDQPQ